MPNSYELPLDPLPRRLAGPMPNSNELPANCPDGLDAQMFGRSYAKLERIASGPIAQTFGRSYVKLERIARELPAGQFAFS